MKKSFIILLFLLNLNCLLAEKLMDGYLESYITGSDVNASDSKEIKINALSGKANVIMPKDNELNWNLEINSIINEKGKNLKKSKYWSAAGARYTFYGLKGWSLGVKGSLDYDHFFELTQNKYDTLKYEYDRVGNNLKTENDYYINKTDTGVKFYAEGVYKPIPEIALILWNELVYDKLETNLPESHKSFEPTITVTPKFIFEKYLFTNIKFVTELFVENRKYFNRTIDLEGKNSDWYSKLVLTQHMTIDIPITDKLKFYSYNNISYEQLKDNKNGQIILKISPRLEYSDELFNTGIYGGEYRFQDEMGMKYDNAEMFAYKLVGEPDWSKVKFNDFWKYEAQSFSLKAFFEFKPNKNVIVGEEVNYKYGKWFEYIIKEKTNDTFLIEKISKSYIKYSNEIMNNFNLNAGIEYTIKKYNESLIINIENFDYISFNIGIKYIL